AFGLTVQPPGPDLVVASELGAAAMTVGQPVSFTVSVDNAGNATAASAAFTLTLPVSVTLASANPPATSAVAGGYRWNLGSLAPAALKTITLTVALDPLLAAQVSFDPDVQPSGNLTYTLRAGSPTPDIDPVSNVQQVVVPVTLPGPDTAVWMGVLGAGAPGTLTGTQAVTYTIRYGHFGNQIAQTSTLTLS